MSQSSRRVFMIQVAAGGTALACGHVMAAAKKIEETEPKAVALGFRMDTNKVDKAKFPKHKATENCSNCIAYLGKPTDAWAECDLLPDRQVPKEGWCSSYVKAK